MDWREYPQVPQTPPLLAAGAHAATLSLPPCQAQPSRQAEQSEGLCTMRVRPDEERGWLCGEHKGKGVALAYVWERWPGGRAP